MNNQIVCRTIGACVLTVTVACQPDGTAPTDTSVRSRVGSVSPQLVHERNGYDWVGKLHNEIVRRAVYELRQPGTKLRDLCPRLRGWIEQSPEFTRILPDSGRSVNRVALSKLFSASPVCTRLGKVGTTASMGRLVSGFWTSAAVEDISAEAYGLIDDVSAALSGASDPNDLASSLSPILSEASVLGGNDAIAVESAASVAQGSYEEWYNGGLANMVAPIQNDWEACLEGNAENETLELDGVTYICFGSSWHVTTDSRNRTRLLQLHLASFTPIALQGCALNHKGVAEDDLLASTVALYAVIQSGEFFLNPLVAVTQVATIAAGVSIVSAVAATIDYVKCFFGIS